MNLKLSKVSKFVGAGVVAASLAIAPLTLPVQAQNNNNNTDTTTQQNRRVDTTGPIRANTERDNNNLGWFGLLGLIGLAGLARNKRTEEVSYVNNDPNSGVRSGSDSR
ncbi:MAG: WGxxGxxG family protein [Potamolinea sp.]